MTKQKTGCAPCEKAKHFAKAAVQVATGEVVAVSKDIQAKRLDICKKCEHLVRLHDGLPETADIGLLDRCNECGCVLRAKAAFEFDCPLGKWQQIQAA